MVLFFSTEAITMNAVESLCASMTRNGDVNCDTATIYSKTRRIPPLPASYTHFQLSEAVATYKIPVIP